VQRPEGGHTNDVSGRASCVLSARVTYERLTRPDAATTRTSRYLVGPPGASSVRVTACAAVLCHAPLVPSPKNGVVQTRSPRSGSPKSPSSLDAPRTCVQRRLTFTHLSPCLSHWPVGPETNHETTSPCNILFVQHPLHGHHQARLRNSALESRLVTPGTSLRIGYQDGWHGTQMSGNTSLYQLCWEPRD